MLSIPTTFQIIVIDGVTYIVSTVIMCNVEGNFKIGAKESKINKEDVQKELSTKMSEKRVKSGKVFNLFLSVHRMATETFFYLQHCGFGLLILMKASGALVWGSADVLNILYARVEGDEEKTSARIGQMYSCIGVGCLIGPIFANAFIVDGKRPITMQIACIWAFAIIVLGWIFVANAPTFPLVCFFTIFRTMGSAIIWFNATLILQVWLHWALYNVFYTYYS